jgi:Flp pilus assembly pilin Flp
LITIKSNRKFLYSFEGLAFSKINECKLVWLQRFETVRSNRGLIILTLQILKTRTSSFLKNQSGATAIEYCMIASAMTALTAKFSVIGSTITNIK